MADWLYKATRTKATRTETLNLAFLDHFIARSAYEQNHSRADNVWDVAFGDTLHLYYSEPEKLVPLGSYLISLPPADSIVFGAVVEETALVRVKDPAFESRWCGDEKPYDIDPLLGCLVGWHVQHLKGTQPPPGSGLRHQATLIRHTQATR